MKKAFRLGLIVGRFQTLHLGHQAMIDTAAALCEKVVVFIGSSQESGTAKNPFTYEMRRKYLRKVCGRRIKIYPLPDIGVGNTPEWGEYLLNNVTERFGESFMPELPPVNTVFEIPESDQTVESVSEAVGYENVEHFNRLFKKAYGVTPLQFKKQR